VTPGLADFVQGVRKHYLDQFLAFIAELRQCGTDGSPELKLKLKSDVGQPYKDFYCIDFAADPGKPRLIEFQPDRYLTFAPIAFTLGGMSVRIVAFRWNDIIIRHDKPDLRPECFAEWFETWFDPDDKRHDPTVEPSGVIHAFGASEQSVSADLGSAPADAFWSLLETLEKAGVKNIQISHTES
jgi:hypothetical protein